MDVPLLGVVALADAVQLREVAETAEEALRHRALLTLDHTRPASVRRQRCAVFMIPGTLPLVHFVLEVFVESIVSWNLRADEATREKFPKNFTSAITSQHI